jgi:hypothetical protein
MAFSGGDPVCLEILQALGLKEVIDLDISMHLGSAAEITVRYYADREDIKKIVPLLRKYKLVPIEAELFEITAIGDSYRSFINKDGETIKVPLEE